MKTSRRAYLWCITVMAIAMLGIGIAKAAPRVCSVSATNNILTVVWCDVPLDEWWIVEWVNDINDFSHSNSSLVTHVSLTGEVVFKIQMTEQRLFLRLEKL